MSGLGDPRGREADELSWRAEKATRLGHLAEARDLYARAAAIEQAIALDSVNSPIRVRSVLAVSATALWYKAARWREAQLLAHRWLSQPDHLTPDAQAELRTLLQRSWSESQFTAEELDDMLPVEIRLMGGAVGHGLAPAKTVKRKEERFIAMLERTGEWTLGFEYREAGKSPLARSLDVLQAPASAASYGIQLYVRSSMQNVAGASLSTSELLKKFFDVVSTAPEEMERVVPDERYRQVFLEGLHELSADGEQVEDVVYSSPTWRMRLPEVHLDAGVRERVAKVRAIRRETPTVIEGRLCGVRLTQTVRWLEIDVEGRRAQKIDIEDARWDERLGNLLRSSVRVRVRPEGKRLILEDLVRIEAAP
jgi:hypothetical protein